MCRAEHRPSGTGHRDGVRGGRTLRGRRKRAAAAIEQAMAHAHVVWHDTAARRCDVGGFRGFAAYVMGLPSCAAWHALLMGDNPVVRWRSLRRLTCSDSWPEPDVHRAPPVFASNGLLCARRHRRFRGRHADGRTGGRALSARLTSDSCKRWKRDFLPLQVRRLRIGWRAIPI